MLYDPGMSALPNLQTESTFSLSAVVREALEGDEADPHAIAGDIISRMSLTEAREALAKTLPDYVAKIIHGQRRRPMVVSESSRWSNVAQLHASGELTLLRARVFALGSWKFLGDCTREDVEAIAEDRKAEATANTQAAERFRSLRAAMGKRHATVVSEVPAEVLEDIFNA